MEKKKYIIKYPDKKSREEFKELVKKTFCHQPEIDKTMTPPKKR